jgi:prevent-host-death family protein
MQRTASIAELKARLSEFLAAVRAGEDVIVTDRGRPVARLTSLGGEPARQSRLEELVRAGLARPASAPLDAAFLKAARPEDPDGRGVAIVLDDRSESG